MANLNQEVHFLALVIPWSLVVCNYTHSHTFHVNFHEAHSFSISVMCATDIPSLNKNKRSVNANEHWGKVHSMGMLSFLCQFHNVASLDYSANYNVISYQYAKTIITAQSTFLTVETMVTNLCWIF